MLELAELAQVVAEVVAGLCSERAFVLVMKVVLMVSHALVDLFVEAEQVDIPPECRGL